MGAGRWSKQIVSCPPTGFWFWISSNSQDGPKDKAVCVLAVTGPGAGGVPYTILHLGGPDLGVRITAQEALTVEQSLLRQPVLKPLRSPGQPLAPALADCMV